MLQAMILQGQSPDQQLTEKIVLHIASEPAGAYLEIMSGARRALANDDALAVYVWAIGYTRLPIAVDDIAGFLRTKRPLRVRINAWTALAQIGTDEAGGALADELARTSNKEERSYILWKMAEMGHKPALSMARELLKSDPTRELWRVIFVYANFGHDALPVLQMTLKSKNRNERYSSALLLGTWLILPESAGALKDAYSAEPDPVIRRVIVGALERVMEDRVALEEFMGNVAANDPAEEVSTFANEYLDRAKSIKNGVFAAKSARKMDRDAFQREYEGLYKSAGAYGDYEALGKSSTYLDEQELLRLRRAVLARENDAALEDYQKINEIIITNRLIEYYSAR